MTEGKPDVQSGISLRVNGYFLGFLFSFCLFYFCHLTEHEMRKCAVKKNEPVVTENLNFKAIMGYDCVYILEKKRVYDYNDEDIYVKN